MVKIDDHTRAFLHRVAWGALEFAAIVILGGLAVLAFIGILYLLALAAVSW